MNNSETSKAQEEARCIVSEYTKDVIGIAGTPVDYDEALASRIALALSLRDKKIERMEKVVEKTKEFIEFSDGYSYDELKKALEEYEKETKSKGNGHKLSEIPSCIDSRRDIEKYWIKPELDPDPSVHD